MSPWAHIPLSRPASPITLVIYIGEPDSNESPTCQVVQGQGGCKTNPVAVTRQSHLLEGGFREWKPARGGPGIDTLSLIHI